MKNNLPLELMGRWLSYQTRQAVPATERKATIVEYHRILSRAGDIGKHNPLLSSYALGAWFLAMNRNGQRTPDENCTILTEVFQTSRMFRLVMGDADHYLAPKRFKQRQQWSKNTHLRQYENDWVVDVLPGTDSYDLGYNYLECGVCKLCQAEGCPELAQYLCRLDFLFAEIMGLHLERTTTLAQGGPMCDFRFCRK